DAHGVRQRVGALVPGAPQQLARAVDAASRPRQHHAPREPPAGQRQAAAVADDLAAARVGPQARELPRGLPRHPAPPGERRQPAAVSMRIGGPLPDATMLSATPPPEGPGTSRARTATS